MTTQGAAPEQQCQQCGATFPATARTRALVRAGRLPHLDRRTPRAGTRARAGSVPTVSDEALLLTEAPLHALQADRHAAIRTFSAPGSNRPDPELGRIITLNRGKHGGGSPGAGAASTRSRCRVGGRNFAGSRGLACHRTSIRAVASTAASTPTRWSTRSILRMSSRPMSGRCSSTAIRCAPTAPG